MSRPGPAQALRQAGAFRHEPHRVGWPDGFTEADADRSYWEWPHEEIIPD